MPNEVLQIIESIKEIAPTIWALEVYAIQVHAWFNIGLAVLMFGSIPYLFRLCVKALAKAEEKDDEMYIIAAILPAVLIFITALSLVIGVMDCGADTILSILSPESYVVHQLIERGGVK